jgi:hypothetical protein
MHPDDDSQHRHAPFSPTTRTTRTRSAPAVGVALTVALMTVDPRGLDNRISPKAAIWRPTLARTALPR